MSIFANVAPITSVQADTIRTGKYTLDSNIYDAVIKMAFMEDSNSSRARGVKLDLAVNVDGKTRNHTETIWIAGRDGKFAKPDGSPTYGMEQFDTLTKLTVGTGVELLEVTVCKIEVKKGEALQDREVFRSLVGQKVKIGLKETRKNRQVKVNDKWVDSADESLSNNVDKFFDTEGLTLSERISGKDNGFIETWKEAFAGKLDDRYKTISGSVAGVAGAAPATGVSSGSLI